MDSDLVVRAQNGDRDAFTAIAQAVGGRLHAVALSILRAPDLADDATQQALVGAWRTLPRLRDPARFEAWMFRLVVNACRLEARQARRWTLGLAADPTGEPIAADEFGAVVDRDQLERGFRRLSLDHRAVVVLHHYLGLPLDQVAEVLDVPLETARSRLRHALRGLRAALEADARQPAVQGRPSEATR